MLTLIPQKVTLFLFKVCSPFCKVIRDIGKPESSGTARWFRPSNSLGGEYGGAPVRVRFPGDVSVRVDCGVAPWVEHLEDVDPHLVHLGPHEASAEPLHSCDEIESGFTRDTSSRGSVIGTGVTTETVDSGWVHSKHKTCVARQVKVCWKSERLHDKKSGSRSQLSSGHTHKIEFAHHTHAHTHVLLSLSLSPHTHTHTHTHTHLPPSDGWQPPLPTVCSRAY